MTADEYIFTQRVCSFLFVFLLAINSMIALEGLLQQEIFLFVFGTGMCFLVAKHADSFGFMVGQLL